MLSPFYSLIVHYVDIYELPIQLTALLNLLLVDSLFYFAVVAWTSFFSSRSFNKVSTIILI